MNTLIKLNETTPSSLHITTNPVLTTTKIESVENPNVERALIKLGNERGPILVCLPGLLGGPEDFSNYIPSLEKDFHIAISNPNVKARQVGLTRLSEDVLSEVTYDSTALDLYELLQNEFPNKKFYFLGVSLGGKVVYDFALKFPQSFRGGLITDVGLSSFEKTPLYSLVESIVHGVNLNLSWEDMKKYLRQSIPEKNLRILIQSQIQYPTGSPPAKWKVGMKNFRSLLSRQSIDEQYENYLKVDSLLYNNNNFIHVIRSDHASGISEEDYLKMLKLKSLKFYHYSQTGHFLHISHREEILRLIQSVFLSQSGDID